MSLAHHHHHHHHPPTPVPTPTPADLRALFPAVQRQHYFASFRRGPVSTVARAAVVNVLDAMVEVGGETSACLLREVAQRCRRSLAEFLDAPGGADEIAFCRNTADAVSIVANGMNWQPGDEIVITDREYPANVFPWQNLIQRLGVVLRIVPTIDEKITVAQIEAALTARTRLVALSTVYFTTGFRLDVPAVSRLCQQHGAILLLDAVQSLATEPFSCRASGADYVVGDARKFIGGVDGVGFLWGRGELLFRLKPAVVGAESVIHSHDRLDYRPEWHENARRFEPGALPSLGLAALDAALGVWQRIGLSTVAQWIGHVRDLFWDSAAAVPGVSLPAFSSASERSAIIALRLDPATIATRKQRAEQANIAAGFYPDGRAVFAVHGFTLPADITAALAVFAD